MSKRAAEAKPDTTLGNNSSAGAGYKTASDNPQRRLTLPLVLHKLLDRRSPGDYDSNDGSH